ncbi:MAG: glycosyl transferase [Bacteroidetes bacterium CG2_30_33_31]|nr:MAG: glycosyl transferase [Bacteroidetes bacterium CG2_30_33_31]
MQAIKITFWILIFIVFYAYIGYGILLYLLLKIKRTFKGKPQKPNIDGSYQPGVTLFVTAFNEKDYVDAKIKNSMSMEYPKEKLHLMWVTDGTDDGTDEYIKEKYPEVELHHKPERNGKIAAMNRGSHFVKTPIVIFSDANTMLGIESVRRIVDMFADPKVGCVSGEKRIFSNADDTAAGAGEGIYWKYESTLKRWDAELYSVVGAAGELFAVRSELFEEVEGDTLLDDFIVSLRIAMKGLKIQYDPEAYAIEDSSANVKEELKRKIRIAAGGIQSVIRLKALLNPFKYGVLSFQYISHRVLRWTLAPLSLLFILFINIYLAYNEGFNYSQIFTLIFIAQILFYLMALLGWFLENRNIKVKILYIPYYFFIMNYAVYRGFFRYMKGKQSVNWERAKRAK